MSQTLLLLSYALDRISTLIEYPANAPIKDSFPLAEDFELALHEAYLSFTYRSIHRKGLLTFSGP